MSSVSSLLDEAIRENPADAPMSPFEDVMGETCRWLNATYAKCLGAGLSDGSAPGVRYLMIWPKGHRHEKSIFVGAYLTERTAQILGSDAPLFSEKDTFARHIAALVKRPSFREVIALFQARAGEPVDGVLRVGASQMVTLLADLRVKIDASEQHRLANAAESEPPIPRIEDLKVEIVSGTYSKQREPHWFLAGGYALAIDHVTEDAGGRLLLTGTPTPASELD